MDRLSQRNQFSVLRGTNRSFGKKMLFAVSATFLALVVRLVFLQSVLENKHPFSLFIIAVGASAFYGGLLGGMLSIGLSFACAFFYFNLPVHLLAPSSADALVRSLLFLLTGVSISLLFEMLHGAWRQSAYLENKLKEKAHILMEKDRRKDEFLALLAHELRNPLAPISNALQILESPHINMKMHYETIKMANRQVGHMVRLLDDLLDVSRIAHGKIVLQRKHIDLCEAMKTAIDSVNPLISERDHVLASHLPDHPVWVNGDATRLSQLFGNLLNNAAKYTENRGRITLQVYEDREEVAVRIADNGIGIPENKLPHIFDLFVQVDSSLERSQGGLGIGLMLVKKIAELHGGSVEVYSAGKGMGTEFTIRLPLAEASHSEQKPQEAKVSTPASRTCRVLVVDDNEASAKTLGWMLEMLGHDIRLAHNGRQTLELAQSFLPDIILLDIGMPDMSGYEICERIRKETALKSTILIAQTGWGQEKDIQRSKEAGFHHHLIKPINIATLEALFETLHLPEYH